MKTIQEAFEENYMAYEEPADNKKGFRIRYAYVGLWYVFDPHSRKRGQRKALIGALCLCSTVLFATAALWNSGLNASSLTGLFTGLSLAAFLFQWYGTIILVSSGEKMTKDSFVRVNHLLRIAPSINALLLAGSAVSGMVYMRSVGSRADLPAVLMYLLAAAAAFMQYWEYRKTAWEKQENPAMNDTTKSYIRA